MPDDKQDLSFADFHKAVGNYGEAKIRAAIMALRLTPYTKFGDMRRLYYSSEWVTPVRQFLETNH